MLRVKYIIGDIQYFDYKLYKHKLRYFSSTALLYEYENSSLGEDDIVLAYEYGNSLVDEYQNAELDDETDLTDASENPLMDEDYSALPNEYENSALEGDEAALPDQYENSLLDVYENSIFDYLQAKISQEEGVSESITLTIQCAATHPNELSISYVRILGTESSAVKIENFDCSALIWTEVS